jgi:hypothetical protein
MRRTAGAAGVAWASTTSVRAGAAGCAARLRRTGGGGTELGCGPTAAAALESAASLRGSNPEGHTCGHQPAAAEAPRAAAPWLNSVVPHVKASRVRVNWILQQSHWKYRTER